VAPCPILKVLTAILQHLTESPVILQVPTFAEIACILFVVNERRSKVIKVYNKGI
jgi:hypothetical protein